MKGNEMKGKERKGKERKEKERKGEKRRVYTDGPAIVEVDVGVAQLQNKTTVDSLRRQNE